MKKIGIDFGTTNSTIAYLDAQQRIIIGHKFGGVGNEYFPSAIAYPKKADEPILIGVDAQQFSQTNPGDYHYYEFYKINLCSKYDQILNGEHRRPDGSGIRVIDLVKDYLHLLIDRYKKENFPQEAQKKLEYIALAIPNVLYENHIDHAEDIKRELKTFLGNEAEGSDFCSEARCACEFYISKKENKGFIGDIVVVDYGGGTLDISNCRVTPNPAGENGITVVAQGGTSTDERNTFGFAGLAFDQEVVQRIPELSAKIISEDDIKKYGKKFEQTCKIPYYRVIMDILTRYYASGMDKPIAWEVDGLICQISASLFYESFEKVNLPLLEKHFDQIIPPENRENEGAAAQDSFRVLLIGGFSQLLCVEMAVRNFLGIDMAALHDQRIAQVTMTEKFIAVAYGAALYANKSRAEPEPEFCLFEIGLKSFDGRDLRNDILIKENTDLKAIGGIQWSNPYVIWDGNSARISIYCRTSTSGETVHELDISSVCTNNCTTRFGVTAKGNIYTLHVQNMHTGTEETLDLSMMVAEYKDRNSGEM